MAAQREVSRRRQAARVGQKISVLVDEPVARGARVPQGVRAIARSQHEAPEVDGVVLLRGLSAQPLQPGALVTARVVQGLDYDVMAEITA
jgi:ribosomal protein S12 methylthiotransferase